MNTFKLGRSIAQIVPFHRIPIQQPIKQKEIITKKVLIIFGIVVIIKIIVLLLWI